MNSVSLVGRITKDPELRKTMSGDSFVSFTIAVDRIGSKDKADFINCVAWEHTAEFLSKYFTKGQEIGVDGEVQTRNYNDKNGNKRTAVEIRAGRIFFVGGKTTTAAAENATGGNAAGAPIAGFEEISSANDLPF